MKSFLNPSLVYLEALREAATRENRAFATREIEISVGLIFGNLRRVKCHLLSYWDHYVLEISTERMTAELVERKPHHVELVPNSNVKKRANIFVVD